MAVTPSRVYLHLASNLRQYLGFLDDCFSFSVFIKIPYLMEMYGECRPFVMFAKSRKLQADFDLEVLSNFAVVAQLFNRSSIDCSQIYHYSV